MKRTYKLAHPIARERAAQDVMTAPEGWVVTVSPPNKTRDQEAKYHAMFSDIAKQCEFMGQRMDAEDWKRVLVDAFERVMRAAGTPIRHGGRIVPSLDGHGFLQLGVQTRSLLKSEASEFIEYLYAFGSERQISWSDHAIS